MIIAVSSEGNNLESKVDARFGRASSFVIINTDSDSVSNIANTQNLNAQQGAGIQAAKHILNAEADVLLTGHVGPKAFKVLSQGDVKVYTGVQGTVKEAIEALNNNKLQLAKEADVEGHW